MRILIRIVAVGVTVFLLFLGCRGTHDNSEPGEVIPGFSVSISPRGAPPDGGVDGGTVTDGGTGTSVPELLALVTSGQYQSWRRDPGVHGSAGPHVASGRLRIFMNEALATSQASNPHATGSIAVMELYDSSGVQVIGHAVSGRDEHTWNFVRGFRPSYSTLDLDSSAMTDGGTPHPCVSCHMGAVDFVWWRLP